MRSAVSLSPGRPSRTATCGLKWHRSHQPSLSLHSSSRSASASAWGMPSALRKSTASTSCLLTASRNPAKIRQASTQVSLTSKRAKAILAPSRWILDLHSVRLSLLSPNELLSTLRLTTRSACSGIPEDGRSADTWSMAPKTFSSPRSRHTSRSTLASWGLKHFRLFCFILLSCSASWKSSTVPSATWSTSSLPRTSASI
mmetsp:Transcript_5391/g.19410  ORF Transcript_5391/g.19410 Transcript_5391/m.19410 type:complete len:200 (+) Transcript_5391:274-873(+)